VRPVPHPSFPSPLLHRDKARCRATYPPFPAPTDLHTHLQSARSCRTVCGSYAPTAGSLHIASASTSPWLLPPPASFPSPPPSAPPAPQQERGRRQRDHLAAYTPLLSFFASKRAAPGFIPRTPPLLSHSPLPPPPAPPVARMKGGLDSEITSLSIPPFSPSPRRANERRPVSHNGRRPLLSTSPLPPPSAPPAPQQKRGVDSEITSLSIPLFSLSWQANERRPTDGTLSSPLHLALTVALCPTSALARKGEWTARSLCCPLPLSPPLVSSCCMAPAFASPFTTC
jgi:hypothetical protein